MRLNLIKVATAGTKEAKQLEAVKRAFDKAWKADGKANGDTTRYSLSKDIENFDNSWYNEVELPTENNKNYAGGENSGNQNTELLAGREVSAVDRSGNSVWQQSANSAKLAGYLGQNSEFERKVPKGCRAGESGWVLQKVNTQSGQEGHAVSLLRRISRVVPSGKDTIGRIISPETSEKFANTVFKDEDGNLLSLYHWTTAEFEEFAKGEFGFHFGTLDAAHDRYSVAKEYNADTPRGNYKEVFLNITNPIELSDDLGEWEAGWVARQLLDMGIITEHQYDLLSLTAGFYETTYDNPAAKAVRDILERNGYDGIIYRNKSEDAGSFSVIALHPEQILTVAENGVLKENSGVIDDTNDIAPTNEVSSTEGGLFDEANTDIRYSLNDTNQKPVDKYTQKQYNDFGWARDIGAITKNEVDDLYSKTKVKRSLKDFPQSIYGEAILEVNDEPHTTLGVNNVIAFVKGTKNNPEITRVVRVNFYDEESVDIFRKDIYANTSYRALEAYARVVGEEFIQYYDRSNSATYREYTDKSRSQRSGSEGEGIAPVNRNRNQRNGSFEQAQSNDIAPINEVSSDDDAFFDAKNPQYSLSWEGDNRTLGGGYRFSGKDLLKSEQDIAPVAVGVAPIPEAVTNARDTEKIQGLDID